MEQINNTTSNEGQYFFDTQVLSVSDSGTDGGSDDPRPVASDFTSIGNGTPLLADEIIDGGLSGGVDDAPPERRTSRGVVVGQGGHGLACRDGSFYGLGDLLPSGLISEGGDEVFLLGARNRSASNASGNLVGPDSGADPFAAPSAGLI